MSVISITTEFVFESILMIIKMILGATIWELAKPKLAKGLNYNNSIQRKHFGGLLVGWMGRTAFWRQSYRGLGTTRVTDLQVFYQKW